MTEEADARMSLMDHLGELRSRLIRCVIAVLVLGVLSLAFSRTLFGLLMRPVLDALPPDSRALIYTSGIEEVNVLMKVGLYAGVFFSTPVVLWQIWGFIAPGLFPNERKYAAPFVMLGSFAFIAGTLFTYYVLLPQMFNFLLRGGDAAALNERVRWAERQEEEVLRYVRVGDLAHAAELARESSDTLSASGDGQVEVPSSSTPERLTEASDRVSALGRMVDALTVGVPNATPVLRQMMGKRLAALKAVNGADALQAATFLNEATALVQTVDASRAQELSAIWSYEQHLTRGRTQQLAESWTRPMLSMSEQLTLVLVLELALGFIFELPLVMALLAVLGVVKASFLMKYQRHAFVVCLIAAAVITPTGDAVNLALMAGPMILCYELGVVAAWVIEKRRARRTAITPTGS